MRWQTAPLFPAGIESRQLTPPSAMSIQAGKRGVFAALIPRGIL